MSKIWSIFTYVIDTYITSYKRSDVKYIIGLQISRSPNSIPSLLSSSKTFKLQDKVRREGNVRLNLLSLF